MRYSFPQLQTATRFQTYNVVRRALVDAGHIVSPNIETDCDAVLYSACDVLDMRGLRKLRKQTDKPIIVGGAFAYNYWSAILYSDIVWIGEIFNFAKLNNLADIANSECAFTGTRKQLIADQYIDWCKIPITQISKYKAYYWAGVGCKNHCHFCFTSWTHSKQENSPQAISRAVSECSSRRIHLMLTANFYENDPINDPKTNTRDFLLQDYLLRPVAAQLIRCGIEFAREDTRKLLGKEISKNDIFAAIQKMDRDNTALRLFHITGYEPLSDWEFYIDDLAKMLSRCPNRRLLHLMFNNLQYQNYTPLYSERRKIDPEKYADFHLTKIWYDKLRQYSTHILVSAPSPFRHVACRMGLELSRNREQAEYWLRAFSRKAFTTQEAYTALFTTGIMDTPRVVLKTGGVIAEIL